MCQDFLPEQLKHVLPLPEMGRLLVEKVWGEKIWKC